MRNAFMWLSISGVNLFSFIAQAGQLPRPSDSSSVGTGAQEIKLSAEDLVRMRCNIKSENTYMTWTGTVYAFIPGQPQKTFFKIEGMSVTQCFKDATGQWKLSSRELTYYKDPTTGEVIHSWLNPITNVSVPVVHVANQLVQFPIAAESKGSKDEHFVTFSQDVNLAYPNSLASDARFADYSPQPLYQAFEFFKLSSPAESFNSSADSLPLSLAWTRQGPWLPWMKMGNLPGMLVYSAEAHKVASFDNLPARMKNEIENRLPLYKNAPHCIVVGPNVTSWKYFAAHFDEYLKGAEFPLAAAIIENECVVAP